MCWHQSCGLLEPCVGCLLWALFHAHIWVPVDAWAGALERTQRLSRGGQQLGSAWWVPVHLGQRVLCPQGTATPWGEDLQHSFDLLPSCWPHEMLLSLPCGLPCDSLQPACLAHPPLEKDGKFTTVRYLWLPPQLGKRAAWLWQQEWAFVLNHDFMPSNCCLKKPCMGPYFSFLGWGRSLPICQIWTGCRGQCGGWGWEWAHSQGLGDRTLCLETQEVFPLLNSHTAEGCKRNMEVRLDIIM